ncbi:Ras-related protein Rab [Acrasis kona]|uniref:small monomeric GTPase n=1 Tax=Acrasis kona TaxID=1008807 RepID=A0AAW2Z7J2_9EUKA
MSFYDVVVSTDHDTTEHNIGEIVNKFSSKMRERKKLPLKKVSILVTGKRGVGKKCMIERYVNPMGYPNYSPTVRLGFRQKKKLIEGGGEFDVFLWHPIRPLIDARIIKFIQCVIFVFDTTNRTSFEGIPELIRKVRQESSFPDKIVMMIVGNKIDLRHARTVSKKEASDLAGVHKCKYKEVSSLTNEGIIYLFDEVVELILLTHSV